MPEKMIVRRQREVIDLLLKEGLVTQDMLEKAREEVKRTGLRIERALEKLGFISDEDIVKVRANALGLPYVDLCDYKIDSELLKLVPEAVAKKFKVIPLFRIANTITLGMIDPQDIVAIDQVRRVTQVDMVEPALISDKGFQMVMDSYYTASGSIDEILRSIENLREEGRGLKEIAEEPPIIRLVNVLITQAVKDRSSDIHIEPEEQGLRVRCRVDGILQESAILPKKLQSAVISRVKVLARLDIAENRKPQDGRIWLKVENRDLDIRVSTFPTVHGENVVLRLLDKASVLLGLRKMGLLEKDLEMLTKLIRRPNGIVLVTGPTGSGKTSTLYSVLTTISSIEKNIITIEDPVEYELPLIRQTEVNAKAGITFANGLRSILRQDPDIIMVGEIRDKETADVAIQAAMTGHLVFATLHTNDAPSALTRLIDMGVEPFLVASSVVGIVAQRLVRVVCEKCREAYRPAPEALRELGLPEGTECYRGRGCGSCKGSGLIGRTGIFEILMVNEEIRRMVDAKQPVDEIKRKAKELGLKTLREDGLAKVQQGLTTLEEVLRVTEVE